MHYLHDGSFESFANALEIALKRSDAENFCCADDAQTNLFGNVFTLSRDEHAARGFVEKINAYSTAMYSSMCTAYLSEISGYEMTVYNFFRAVKEKGIRVIENLADERCREMNRIVRKVNCERHRTLGLLRFSELSDKSWYACFEPDHNITPLIARHFCDRLPHDWIIHDLRRGIGAINRGGKYDIFSMDAGSEIEYSEMENEYRRIWKRYHSEIAIPERTNPACQKRFMPKRYWKHLTEMN